MTPTVTRLWITPVKGTRLQSVPEIELQQAGAHGNRRFFVIDEHDRMLNGKQLADLTCILAEYREQEDILILSFPDGSSAEGPVQRGESIATRFFSRTAQARLLNGPWAAALSEHLGQPLRIVEGPGAVDRGRRGGASLISSASFARLQQAAGSARVDPRRFRMLIEVDGVPAHAEDGWVDRIVRVGDATVRVNGHVGRCLVTSRHPDTGRIDLPTLDLLRSYRGEARTTHPMAFGIFGEVLDEGKVRVGDSMALVA